LKLITNISKLTKLSYIDAMKKIAEVLIRFFRNWHNRRVASMSCTYHQRPRWFINIDDSCFILSEKGFLNKHKEDIFELADRYLDHNFNLLGSGWVKVGYGNQAKGLEEFVYPSSNIKSPKISPKNQEVSEMVSKLLPEDYQAIDWQVDFKSGYRWDDDDWYKDISYGHIPGPDIKIPWEIGRMQHLIILAWAAIISNEKTCNSDNKFCFEIKNQILDFIASNPPQFGVQWMSNMDVSIRLCNWLFIFDFLKSYDVQLKDDFLDVFYNSIYDHYYFIANNLEHNVGMKANHYFANIIGLLFASAYFPENEETLKILNFSINELISETYNQFYDDGSNFEQSTYYHCLVSEMLLNGVVLIKRLSLEKIIALNFLKIDKLYEIDLDNLEIVFPEKFNNKLSKIIGFANIIESENNNIFRIGDDDGGYFLANYYKLFSLTTNNTKTYNISYINKLYSLVNEYYKRIFPINKIIEYQDFGLYIKKNENYKLIFRCGGIGQNAKGGHSHNDQLSFVFSINDLEFIVDPGTYLYTPLHDRRNQFRSVKSHNTLILNDQEQNIWGTESKDDLFWIMKERTKSEVIEFSENKFSGRHFAYSKPHTRIIEFDKNIIICNDICEAVGLKRVAFHFHPEIIIDEQEDGIMIKRNNSSCILKSYCEYKLNDYDYSTSYGVLQKAKVLNLISDQSEIEWKLEILK